MKIDKTAFEKSFRHIKVSDKSNQKIMQSFKDNDFEKWLAYKSELEDRKEKRLWRYGHLMLLLAVSISFAFTIYSTANQLTIYRNEEYFVYKKSEGRNNKYTMDETDWYNIHTNNKAAAKVLPRDVYVEDSWIYDTDGGELRVYYKKDDNGNYTTRYKKFSIRWFILLYAIHLVFIGILILWGRFLYRK